MNEPGITYIVQSRDHEASTVWNDYFPPFHKLETALEVVRECIERVTIPCEELVRIVKVERTLVPLE